MKPIFICKEELLRGLQKWVNERGFLLFYTYFLWLWNFFGGGENGIILYMCWMRCYVMLNSLKFDNPEPCNCLWIFLFNPCLPFYLAFENSKCLRLTLSGKPVSDVLSLVVCLYPKKVNTSANRIAKYLKWWVVVFFLAENHSRIFWSGNKKVGRCNAVNNAPSNPRCGQVHIAF